MRTLLVAVVILALAGAQEVSLKARDILVQRGKRYAYMSTSAIEEELAKVNKTDVDSLD